VKVPYSGTYLHRGTSVEVFRRIEKKIGEELVLTSGVRSIMKQFLLFLDKAYKNDGNLSLASRSLAPPGYSFHGIGDFDVGQRGFGINNFTAHFTGTTVYSKLLEHGYLALRYPDENLLGVRFEPWHIQVAHV
jgi:LAS superfamily LD-carboxypeptidase LdcB